MSIVLHGVRQLPWAKPANTPDGFTTDQVYVGKGEGMALEMATALWSKPGHPTREQLGRLHKLRVNGRATPVVLVVELSAGGITVFGPNDDAAPLGPLPEDQAQRVLQAALDEPNHLAARTRLAGLVQAMDSTAMPGIKNSGLFANHELKVGVPQRTDWGVACEQSTKLLSDRGESLIKNLGFTAGRTGAHALLLTGKGPRPEAIAVMLDEDEAFDADSTRFQISPVAYGLKMAEQSGVPWLIMLRGSQVRLYPARIDLGVGRKGLSETYCEVDLPQLTKDNAGYLSLIFSASALIDGGTAHQILQSSTQYAVALGERLRDRVYDEIIPELSVAVAQALIDQDYEMDAEGLDLAYQLTLRVFFRMLFQVYAEDRKLLPYGENETYDRNAIKTLAKDLLKRDDDSFDEDSTALWDDLAQVWKVIDTGNKSWGVPAYNGGLFTGDKDLNPHGAVLKNITIPDAVMGPVLKALLLDDDGEGGIGPVDFRSLSVREFGTIYEGLLESSLGLAEQDLTLDKDDNWVPAKKSSDQVWAPAGSVYFHNTSGQRKGTGSYFTPSFVVEHLLERSLDPALDAHLEKVAGFLTRGDQASAAELFFDFRVADLAMGSGHFLTSAIDHIEQKMASFLAEDGHFIPGVAAEIQKLEKAAVEAIGPDAIEPDRSSLLRRQIARRCIYGLDINPIAVELARVSIWIHTFVRGLPMSSLDHNLVCANSLTGIGSVDEALDVLVPGRNGAPTFFDADIEEALVSAKKILMDVAMLAEVSKAESQAAARAVKKAEKEAEKAKLLFDAAVLMRIGRGGLVASLDPDELARMAKLEQAQEVLQPLDPAHMPVLFPEVFLRDNGGFDVLIGNPPWKQLMVDELRFWVRAEPGILALKAAELKKKIEQLKRSRSDLIPEFEREVSSFDILREAITTGPYPGVGGGGRAPDLFHAFAWRNWQLLRIGGILGTVFPRTLLMSAVCAEWREEVLNSGQVSAVNIVNSNGWVFPSVHGQYSITFIDIHKVGSIPEFVELSGPFFDYKSFETGRDKSGRLPISLLKLASEGSSLPQLPDAPSAEVFSQIRKTARLSDAPAGSRFRPTSEFNATTDRQVFDSGGKKEGRWPVFGGSSFDIWRLNDSEPYAWSEPKKVIKALQEKRTRQVGLKSSAFYGFGTEWALDEGTLPCVNTRIAFRDVTNATNTRTCIPCLIPAETLLTNSAPYVVKVDASTSKEALLLGVLSSLPLDWYCRRFVELHLSFGDDTDQRRARIIEISGRLAAVDERYADWAKAVGVKVGSVRTETEKNALIAELDALVAHLYGLNRSQVEHVFATFHRGWDYKPRLAEVLKYYESLPEVSQ
jgi:hypothetical protein